MSVSELLGLSDRLSLGTPQLFRNLSVVPLLDGSAPASGWLTLGRALTGDLAEVSEISEQGSVPHLRLLNRASKPIFLLDGEELVGAKQNRILNLSLLVPAEAAIDIPVSCVEQGRWSWRSRSFRDAQRVIFSKLRARNSDSVTSSMARGASTRGDQGKVWAEISLKSARMEVHSDTGAASALFEHYSHDLDEFVAGIKAQQGQVGAAFLVDGSFAGLDLFGGPDLLKILLPRLVRSFALDAIEDAPGASGRGDMGEPNGKATAKGEPPEALVKTAVQVVRTALEGAGELEADRGAQVGLGENLRLRGSNLAGSSLIAAGNIAHLSLWAADWR